MKNIVIMLALTLLLSFTINAQSESCCSTKDTKTSIEKSSNLDQTVKSENKVETTTAALTDNTVKTEKEVVTTKVESKMEHKTSGCCDGKKVKDMMQKDSEVKNQEAQ
jgi:hypothetical protein